ncbi:hypothetical protein FMEXI_1885 [Fusarium mexicanum]|uniref:Zn(2)-C6 fungal-type domain-containing protein n=1 Tax=Fusarium mexicanum TaxID=751941 RepID=A0A8H5N7I1_9HYPO|nr:hypothetical protein FMEXI_1885 [Fusarium mexicanum]
MKSMQVRFRISKEPVFSSSSTSTIKSNTKGITNSTSDHEAKQDYSTNTNNIQGRGRHQSRSRFGCTECKQKHVKCDETYPVCTRCRKRGLICKAAPRLRRWQNESPWTKLRSRASVSTTSQLVDISDTSSKSLLRYWLEKASQIMVIDPDDNPLSFPVLEYVEQCPSLKHALQSVGAAHRNYFDPQQLSKCLEERHSALQLIINDLSCPGDNLFPLFLTILLVGLSTAWTNPPTADFGENHLGGARALVDTLLHDYSNHGKRPSYFTFVIGAYLYWDMSTAFLVPSHVQAPLNTSQIYTAILDIGQEYHPFGGYTTEIFYLLGNVGRYCRSVVETGVRDESIEIVLEEEMEKWQPNYDSPQLGVIGDAFRSHGLISLTAICFRRRRDNYAIEDKLLPAMLNTEAEGIAEWWQNVWTSFANDDLEANIRSRALAVVRDLTSIPSSHACTNLQAIPLFTAASELPKEHEKERELAVTRFKELYSRNHLRANLTVLELLPEIWKRHDAGDMISWMEVMMAKGWNLMLG